MMPYEKRRKVNQMARINEKIQNNTNFINGVSKQPLPSMRQNEESIDSMQADFNRNQSSTVSALYLSKLEKNNIAELIREKQEEIESESKDIKSRLIEQQGIIKKCIINKQNTN